MPRGRPATPHDAEIRRLILASHTDTEIAKALGVSRATVHARREQMALPHQVYVRGREEERARCVTIIRGIMDADPPWGEEAVRALESAVHWIEEVPHA